MNLDLKEIVRLGLDRNIICVDKEAPVGYFTLRLQSILNTVLYHGHFEEEEKEVDDQDFYKIYLNEYLDYYKELGGSLPLDKKFLCALIKSELIKENGIKSEYVLLGAY